VCVLGERTSDLKHITFTGIDPARGLDHEFARFDTDPNASYQWDLSPDGTRIALGEIGSGHIQILSLSGQRLTETTAKGWSSLENLHWSAAGNGFFAASRTAETSVLLSLDLDGNATVLWEQKGTLGNESAGTSGVPSPDGRHLAMMGFTLSGNMWMMENF
jgi:Tol biopolymer transport system component